MGLLPQETLTSSTVERIPSWFKSYTVRRQRIQFTPFPYFFDFLCFVRSFICNLNLESVISSLCDKQQEFLPPLLSCHKGRQVSLKMLKKLNIADMFN